MKTRRGGAARAFAKPWTAEAAVPPPSPTTEATPTVTVETIRIDPRRVVIALVSVAALLLTAHLTLLITTIVTGHDSMFGLVRLFDLDREQNIPSFFSGSLFLINALLFWCAGKTPAQRRRAQVWYILAALFVFLAYDELFSIHERLTEPIRQTLHTTGVLYYAWVIAYALPLFALTAWFLPTWRRLDAMVRAWLMAAATIYVLGAVVIEMFAGAYAEAFGGSRTLGGGLLVACEESFEMAGLIILVHTLLSLVKPSPAPSL